jgi:phytoene dehydrogenase-like protein
LNNSSTQVYLGLKPDAPLERNQFGDLLFSSTAPSFRTDLLLSREATSRTYSFYYPPTRLGLSRSAIVASTNANYADWAGLSREEYEAGKRALIESTLAGLEKYVPDVRSRLDHAEAATPLTFERYTRHLGGASFGTKFEGLAVSRGLPEQIAGLYHAGSVGIIMSGWLGAVNYGVIVANDVDAFLMRQ